MVKRVLLYAVPLVVVCLVGYHYLSTRLSKEGQVQYRRLAEQAEIIKTQQQRIDFQQQQIESLQHQVQKQNGALQEQLTLLERRLRAQMQTATETAAREAPQSAVRIFPLWYPPWPFSGQGCGLARHPCDVFEAGSDVRISVTLTNPSGQQIIYRYLRWWPSTVLEVRDQSGHLVPETTELQKLKKKWFHHGEWTGPPVVDKQWWAGPSLEDVNVLPPQVGAGHSGQVSWELHANKYCDMSRPGKYSIIVKVRSSYPTQKWFESNKVWVTIAPQQSTDN